MNTAIRKTRSFCPKCLKTVSASIDDCEGKVFLKKTCDRHGDFSILLSNHADDYKHLCNAYFSLMERGMIQKDYVFYTGDECYFNCPVCMCDANRLGKKGISRQDMHVFLRENKPEKVSFRGGEPALRGDLPELIRILRRKGTSVALHTCGWNLDNEEYVVKLKESGLNEVHLLFDGFYDLPLIRDNRLTDIRKKALENLKKAGLPTNIEMLVYRGVNENQIKETFDFCLNNEFIIGLFFVGFRYLGRKGQLSLNHCLMPAEIINIFEKKLNLSLNGNTQKEINEFQKINFLIFSLFGIRKCFYNRHYILKRKNCKAIAFSKVSNMRYILSKSENIKSLYKKNRFLGRIYFIIVFFVSVITRSGISDLVEIGSLFAKGVFKLLIYGRSSGFMSINFVTMCDSYSIDLDMVKSYCGKGFLDTESANEAEGLSCFHFKLMEK